MAGTAAEGARLSRSDVKAAARPEVHRAVTSMVTDKAGRTLTPLRTTGRTWPGINAVEPEPIAQIEAARAIEQAAHALIKDLIRIAREAGCSWYEIGNALDLHGHAVAAKEPVAEVAYDYALEYQAGSGIRTVTWTCPACHQLITDVGTFCDLHAREEGHADHRLRWAAELAQWQEFDRSAASKSRGHGHDAVPAAQPTPPHSPSAVTADWK